MAAEVATRYPERVGGLVLVNPAGLYIEGAEIKDIFGRKLAEMIPDLYYDQQHPMAQLMRQFAELAADRDADLPFELVKPVLPDHGGHGPARLGPVPAQPQAPQATRGGSPRRRWSCGRPATRSSPRRTRGPTPRRSPVRRTGRSMSAAHLVMIERPDALAGHDHGVRRAVTPEGWTEAVNELLA